MNYVFGAEMIADELCFGGGNELCLRNGKIL
jgi:hypothetical protein